MPNRRQQIAMTPTEVEEFLRAPRVMNIATIGPSGHPHLVAMWYGFLDDEIAFWTFAKSQKVVNLRRDDRLTALVEDGEQYGDLQGVELVGRGRIVDAYDDVLRIGLSVAERYTGPAAVSDAARPFLEAQAQKRVGVVLDVERTVSWDHTKLSGSY
jgi:PPOX class probable F420-dependent enzyme